MRIAIVMLLCAAFAVSAAQSAEKPQPSRTSVSAKSTSTAPLKQKRHTPTRSSGKPVTLKPAAAPKPAGTAGTAEQAPRVDPTIPSRSCKTDADCAVKDVGNCCGRFPACVNVNAKTDPAAVRAQCAKAGVVSTCGFREVTGCTCKRGRCEDIGQPVGGWIEGQDKPTTTDR